MKLVNQYIIPFKGLTDGDHEFEFEFESPFFDAHELLEVRSGSLKAQVLLTKKPSMLTLEIDIEGSIQIQCDRCLEFFDFPLEYSGTLVVKFSETGPQFDDEIWILHPNDYQLELEQYFFECIGLSLPLQKVHPKTPEGNAGCNAEMIEILKTHSSNIFDEEEEKDIDPRWNKLKDLLNDTNLN